MGVMTDASSGRPDIGREPWARAQDDLFRHVNGWWLDEAAIPDDRALSGPLTDLVDQAEVHLRAILERLAANAVQAGGDEQKLGDFYASFLDESLAERLGAEPLRAELDRIADIDSRATLLHALGQLQRNGVPGVFATFVKPDARQSDRYILYVTQAGLGLPDETYYREERFASIRAAYRAHLETMLGLANLDDPQGTAERIIALETHIAALHWDRVSARDAVRTYTLMDRAGLTDLTPGVDWDAWLAGAAAPASTLDEVVVRQPDFLGGISGLLETLPLADWKDWLSWRLIQATAPLLSGAFVQENFAFYGTVLTGVPEPRERWKRGVGIVESGLGEALGRIYVAEHFPPHSKALVLDLVANLVAAHRRNIEALDWMSPQTKAQALRKLAAFTGKVGYPDRWRDYDAVTIQRTDLVGNVRRAAAAEFDRALAQLGGPIDRGEWFMTPQTVNAYYNAGMNEIVFPAALLQPPFFDPEADPAVNYGAIGAVIGHEIGHGFDDQGSKYDGDGNLCDWWTDSDRAAFDARAAALIAQYDALEHPQAPGRRINGALTIGENIGDIGGLAMSYTAYVHSLGGVEPPVIDGWTGPQRFFMSWARIWRTKARDAEVLRRLVLDPHSPPEFRCNAVVRNLDEFHEAFDVRQADALWLAPDGRVRIW